MQLSEKYLFLPVDMSLVFTYKEHEIMCKTDSIHAENIE